MKKKIILKQEDYKDIDFNKVIDVPQVITQKESMVIELEVKE